MLNNVFIIAEAGVNHNGSLELAKKMIDAAAGAGADAVKFQTFKAETLVAKSAKKAEYQIVNTGNSQETQFEMIKKLELDLNAHVELIAYCKTRNIMFLSSPFDLDSVECLYKLDLPIFKIPSGEIDNLPYLRKIGGLNKKIILSTGMSTLSDIENALAILIEAGAKKESITILHCNTEYPTPMTDVNLNAMLTIRDSFKIKIGYSDHTLGIEVPIAAVTMGAQVIEKHFTLDKNMDGPDHRASLEPGELKNMVTAIRNIELALGNGVKQLSNSEAKNKPIARKSIVAKTDIKVGEIFTEENIIVKRPGLGLSPFRWDDVIGKKSNNDYQVDELIMI